MRSTTRRLRLGAVALLGAMALLGGSGAFAISIPAGDVYTLPVDPVADPTTVDLGAPAPFPGFPDWIRARPNDPSDLLMDYTATVVGSDRPSSGSGVPDDVWIFEVSFEVTWLGTIDESTPAPAAVADRMLFTILDSRFETGVPPGDTFETTYDLVESGFVRSSPSVDRFFVNGDAVTPEIVRDDTIGGGGEGFVSDRYPRDWIGFYLDAVPGVTHTIDMEWALGEKLIAPRGKQVFFPNGLFVAAVPEPGAALLFGCGLLILRAALRRRPAA